MQRITIVPNQLVDNCLNLTFEQHHYLTRVLRLRSGDRFIAIDGAGHWWLAELADSVSEAQPGATILEAIAAQTELPISVTLLIAMPKGNGMDDIVRQVTEAGVTRIIPVVSDRTLLNPSAQKLERWQRIAQEAAEQSERQIVPEITAPLPFVKALGQETTTTNRYICEARGDYPHLLSHLARLTPATAIAIAIGPEGGWTEAELQAAIAQGYQPVSLGRRVLRAITAPLVAVALIASVLESMPE
ncbi:16S rRNA (uracil(1498)-N(3))-methyltransferase [Oscillatoria sp. FACHB-1407]|uniref:16S rRNA (uracil(1498)-N(3))-methyltransferase n=1 Tax=Oscillatoria sp. FACHB-1407 TaxID=2692847 RepID=UPI001F55543A|nr:16S rRNA (uracil(1498)-N(3))-methyltransferase [Oscillatoria sp. FACHB-1407]